MWPQAPDNRAALRLRLGGRIACTLSSRTARVRGKLVSAFTHSLVPLWERAVRFTQSRLGGLCYAARKITESSYVIKIAGPECWPNFDSKITQLSTVWLSNSRLG